MPRYSGGSGGSGHKHHAKKRGLRTRGRYAERLMARGLGKAPTMPTLDSLKAKAKRLDQQSEEEKQRLSAHQAMLDEADANDAADSLLTEIRKEEAEAA